MRVTDADLYTGGFDALRREASPEKLLETLDRFSIRRGVVRHNAAKTEPKTGNALVLSLCAASSGRLSPCVILDPALGEDNLEGKGSLADRLAASSACAAAVFPAEARAVFDPFYWDGILSAAEAVSLPLFVFQEYGSEFFRHLPGIAASYPRVKFVLSGCGIDRSRVIFPLLEKTKNVYFTAAKMLDYLQIEEICSRGFCSRLIFGSSYPDYSPEGALGLIYYADIPDKQKEMILSENWEAIRP